jgi:type VI secretion system secreted protein Hcp
MALDAFLQFKGGDLATEIKGETQDRDMQKLSPRPFDISTWTFGVSQDVNIGSSSGGAGAGKVTFDDFKITKQIDNSSPLFFGTCCTGGHYDDVSLKIRKSGAVKDKSGGIYLQFDFKLVFVTNITWSHNDPSPTEDITFAYGALQVQYWQQQKTGSLATAPATTSWSRVLNNDAFALE